MIADKKQTAGQVSQVFSKVKAFLPLCLALALSKFWQETVYMMSYFLEADLGISAQEIILTSKYQPLGVAIGYAASALVIDRIGIRKMLSASLLIMSIITVLFTQVSSIYMLYVYRLALGCCIAVVYASAFGGLSIIFSKEELPKKTSLLYMWAFGATVVSPRLLTDVHHFSNWKVVVFFILGLTLTSCLMIWKWFPQKVNNIDMSTYLKKVKSLLTHKLFMMMAVVSTLCMGGYYGFVTIFAKNLAINGVSTEVSKFVITDVQFISRLIIFVLTTWAGYRLTKDNVLKYLSVCLAGMCFVGIALFVMLWTGGTLLPASGVMTEIVEKASQSAHVFSNILYNYSGFMFFFLYAALMAVAQPANKSKALSIAGKDAGGVAQSMIGFCLSMGEVIFVIAAQSAWPAGSLGFFVFVGFATFFVFMGLRYLSGQRYVEHD